MIIGQFNGWNIVAPPSYPAWKQVEYSVEDVIGEAESPFTLQAQQQDWGADRWSLNIALPPMSQADAAAWTSWLMEMRGKLNVFQMGDPLKASPAGAAQGTPVSQGANLAGARSILTRGWQPSTQAQLLVADYLQAGYRLHQVISANVDSDANGFATINIWPSLREPTADGDPIILSNPTGLFRLAENKRGWSVAVTKMFGIQVQIKEALGWIGTLTGMAVAANPSTIEINDTSQCTAYVIGTGHFSQDFEWFTAPGAGTITQEGLYTAPGAPGTYQPYARSLFDSRFQANTPIVVQAPGTPPSGTVTSVSVVAHPSSLGIGQTAYMTVTVTGTGNYGTGVAYSCVYGTIDQLGNYLAPSSPCTDTITATSTFDPSKSGSCTVTVLSTPPSGTVTGVTVTVVPPDIYTGGLATCTAVVQGTGNISQAVTWSCSAGSINSSGIYTASATAGPALVTATSVTDPTQSAIANVFVMNPPNGTVTGVTVTASPSTIQTGQSATCTAVVTGTGSFSQGVVWTTNFGFINNMGIYTAPGSAGTATITAYSSSDGSVSGTATITVQATTPPPPSAPWRPSAFLDVGDVPVVNGPLAYDTNLSTAAQFSANWDSLNQQSDGSDVQFIGFPAKIVPSGGVTLSITYAYNRAGSGSLAIYLSISGGAQVQLLNITTTTGTTTLTYTAVPVGTNLANVVIEVIVSAGFHNPGQNQGFIYDIEFN